MDLTRNGYDAINFSIEFPPYFRALKNLPGYFWHIEEKRLYSLKIGGVLRPLTLQKYSWNGWKKEEWPHYRLSTKGRSFNIGVDRIEKIIESPHTIPQVKKNG